MQSSQKTSHFIYSMATVAIMAGGAVLDAVAFIGGNYLFHYLTGGDPKAALKEKKRHNKALKANQVAYAKYIQDRTKLLDWIQGKGSSLPFGKFILLHQNTFLAPNLMCPGQMQFTRQTFSFYTILWGVVGSERFKDLPNGSFAFLRWFPP